MKKPVTPRGKKVCLAEKCFAVTVDGVKYGPFLAKYREKVKYLEKLRGVVFDALWIEAGWLEFEPVKLPRAKKDRTTPLLDGLDFVPIHKRNRAI